MGIWISRVASGRTEDVLRGRLVPNTAIGQTPLKRTVQRVRWSPTHDIAVRLMEEVADGALARGHTSVKLGESYCVARLDTDVRTLRNAKQVLESLGLITCLQRSTSKWAAEKFGWEADVALWSIHPVLLEEQATKHKSLRDLRRFCRNRNENPEEGENDFALALGLTARPQRRTAKRTGENLSALFPDRYPSQPGR